MKNLGRLAFKPGAHRRSVELADPCGAVGRILAWWRAWGRGLELPWRAESDPYRVLVAEILLIRTRRDAAAKVYGRLVERFPTARDMAAADPREVGELIRPLGLRRRAELLVRMAKDLARGAPPERASGVGRYIKRLLALRAGAGGPPALDSNAKRVYERVTGRRAAARPERDGRLAEFFGSCGYDPLEVTYAVIDFAYEICRPRKPKCAECPLFGLCRYGRVQRTASGRRRSAARP